MKAAFLSAECYSWANILRRYVEKYESFLAQKESLNEDESEKLQWLRKKIDWLDPFVEYNDELLSEEDKKNIIHPECADEKRAAYHIQKNLQNFHFGIIRLGEETKKGSLLLCFLLASFEKVKCNSTWRVAYNNQQ